MGGAVRDRLLGLPIKERDWVVVGATPEILIEQGYLSVGKDFPVFLHPKTREEYALARTERKVGRGYKGFVFNARSDVTLEQDLLRRDLTINAIAQTEAGQLIDPYGGEQDIKNRVLRHVSPAFAEDPVRILRIARFAARFGEFHVHTKTQQLMKRMVRAGEVNALVPERVWQETVRALASISAERFFEILDDCGALEIVFAGLTRVHLDLAALQRTIQKNFHETLRFAALLHKLPEERLSNLCHHLRVPKAYASFSLLVVRHIDQYREFRNLSAEDLLIFFEKTDAFRRPKRFAQMIAVCAVIIADQPESQLSISNRLMQAYYVASRVPIAPLIEAGFEKSALTTALHKARCAEIARHFSIINVSSG